jgi:hypothetical protein
MMNPQDKSQLTVFTMLAKKIIFDADRMKVFLKMLGSKEGALQAVHTVLAVIQQKKPIPPAIEPLLGVNTYMVMVDFAQKITGHKADPAIMADVIKTIITDVHKSSNIPVGAPVQSQPMQPQRGLISQGA